MIHHLNVAILDDHQLFANGLSRIIKDMTFIMQVYYCTRYSELHNVLCKDKIEVLFLDLNLDNSRYNGFTVCTELKQHYPALYIAILTEYENKEFKSKARHCGACAYFTKNTSPDILEKFLTGLNNGKHKSFVTGHPGTANNLNTADTFELKERLSGREIEVFDLIVNCCDNHEIQQRLGISYDTFRTHRDNLLKKLNLKNPMQIIQFAYQNKLVE